MRYFQPSASSKLSVVTGPSSGLAKLTWRSSGLAGHSTCKDLDLFHGLSAELPVSKKFKDLKCAKIVTVHDLLYEHLPQQYSFFDRQIYRQKQN